VQFLPAVESLGVRDPAKGFTFNPSGQHFFPWHGFSTQSRFFVAVT